MKKILCFSLMCLTCFLLLCGCNSENNTGNNEQFYDKAYVYDGTQFFVKTQEHQEANDYFICYRYPDGSEEEIIKMGIQNNPFYIIEERLYYTQGDSLYSVDFAGEDKEILYDESDENISFNQIYRVGKGWLYCSGTKWAEISGDPVALDGRHRVPVSTRVKADFSEFQEIEEKYEWRAVVVEVTSQALIVKDVMDDTETTLFISPETTVEDNQGVKATISEIKEGTPLYVYSHSEIIDGATKYSVDKLVILNDD